MEAAAHLTLLPGGFDGEMTPENFRALLARLSELEATVREQQAKLMKAETRRASDDIEDELQGAYATIKAQNRALGTAERKLRDYDDDPENHPRGKEIKALVERWKTATGKPKAKVGSGRVKITKARIADGYPITLEEGAEPEATLELAIDGLCAYQFEVYGKRYREGKESNRKNDYSDALKDEKRVEEMARLGWKARSLGWTPADGWPDES